MEGGAAFIAGNRTKSTSHHRDVFVVIISFRIELLFVLSSADVVCRQLHVPVNMDEITLISEIVHVCGAGYRTLNLLSGSCLHLIQHSVYPVETIDKKTKKRLFFLFSFPWSHFLFSFTEFNLLPKTALKGLSRRVKETKERIFKCSAVD
jgi:hypothetical protein